MKIIELNVKSSDFTVEASFPCHFIASNIVAWHASQKESGWTAVYTKAVTANNAVFLVKESVVEICKMIGSK